jgi:hypothetical protein
LADKFGGEDGEGDFLGDGDAEGVRAGDEEALLETAAYGMV